MGISGTALSWFASYLADRPPPGDLVGPVSAPHPLLTSPTSSPSIHNLLAQ